jgi:hypothetical protein
VPLLAILAFTLILILAAIVLTPLAIVQRYRLGTARRRARGWVATINAAGLALSVVMFLLGAAVTSLWIPGALTHAAAGLMAGSLTGLVGLAMTRWESSPGSLYYTPNRWLVLAITLVVAARVALGFWRSWNAWQTTDDYAAWAAASGAAGSLAAGAVVLGYYLVYWLGVRRRAVRVSVPRAIGTHPSDGRR